MRNVVMTIPNQYGYWDNRGNLLAVSHDGAKIYAVRPNPATWATPSWQPRAAP